MISYRNKNLEFQLRLNDIVDNRLDSFATSIGYRIMIGLKQLMKKIFIRHTQGKNETYQI